MLLALGAQAGLGALSSFFGGRAQTYYSRGDQYLQQAQAYANRAAEIEQLTKGMQLQAKQNEAIAKADIQTLINTHMQAALLGVNLSAQKRVAAQNRVAVKRNRTAELGAAMVDAAAAGTIGASVDAVASDIRRQSAVANAAIEDQADVDSFNYQVSVEQLYRSYEQGIPTYDDTLPSSLPPLVMGSVTGRGPSFGQALLGSVANVGMNYLSSRISLGLGPKASPPPASSTGGQTVKLNGLRFP